MIEKSTLNNFKCLEKYVKKILNKNRKKYNYNYNIIFEGEYKEGKKYKGKEYNNKDKLIFEGEYKDGIKYNGKEKEYTISNEIQRESKLQRINQKFCCRFYFIIPF